MQDGVAGDKGLPYEPNTVSKTEEGWTAIFLYLIVGSSSECIAGKRIGE